MPDFVDLSTQGRSRICLVLRVVADLCCCQFADFLNHIKVALVPRCRYLIPSPRGSAEKPYRQKKPEPRRGIWLRRRVMRRNSLLQKTGPKILLKPYSPFRVYLLYSVFPLYASFFVVFYKIFLNYKSLLLRDLPV